MKVSSFKVFAKSSTLGEEEEAAAPLQQSVMEGARPNSRSEVED